MDKILSLQKLEWDAKEQMLMDSTVSNSCGSTQSVQQCCRKDILPFPLPRTIGN